MKKIIIEGRHDLSGTIRISGAKNSAVALIPAAILSDGIVTIENIPKISDIEALKEILEFLEVKFEHIGDKMIIDSSTLVNKEIPEEISSKLRASYYFMASILGKYKKVDMYFPGGCNIGSRPIDQTLKGFKVLGAKVDELENKYSITATNLTGGNIYLDMPSVGATVNIILASVKANGTTIIENAAKEPEIVNLVTFLNSMGAKITGAGTSKIKIIGVKNLKGGFVEVIPDRIEAGTYLIAGALLGKDLKIENIIYEHIESLILKLKEIGVDIKVAGDSIIVNKMVDGHPVNIKTLGYPGFPTDLQQPMTALLTQCLGISTIEETIYENRFMHVEYLIKMNANISIKNRIATIFGPTNLIGSDVVATDLRAGACMVLAGLIAEGTTVITNIEHVLRGYEKIIEKLSNVGAKIILEEI